MREQIIAALDIGTSKICCFIAKVNDQGRIRVIGIGHQVSKGLKAGTVIDMEETETSIRAAVDTAERMAGGSPIHEVYVNISSGQPKSRIFAVEVDVAGHEISQLDIDHIMVAGQENMQDEDRFIIHSHPISYSIDGVGGAKSPLGMFGEKLSVEIHLSTVSLSPLKNIQACLNHCHLSLKGVVLTPYASALASLVPDERELGSICIDIGGGLTSISAFRHNELVFGDTIPVGGQHVTRDIAQGLSVSEDRAERLKIKFGNCLSSHVPVRDQIDIVQMGEDGMEHSITIPRAMLTSIISPRIEEILELVRDKIIDRNLGGMVGRRIVITGGGSQITGLEELAKEIFSGKTASGRNGGFHVRLGRPISVDGLPDLTAGPAFSTCVGLLNYGAMSPDEIHTKSVKNTRSSIFARMAGWLKENF